MAKKEYIEREAALKLISAGQGCRNICSQAINRIPAADVVEIRHSKWMYDPNGNDWGLGAWLCSLCHSKNDNLGMGNNINPYLFAGSKWCPHCGAKMDGKDDSY